MISNSADMGSPYGVTVTATDGPYSDSQTFNWTVTHLLVNNPGDQTNYDGDNVALQVTATDNLGETVSYSAGGLPPGLHINPGTGMISGLIDATAGPRQRLHHDRDGHGRHIFRQQDVYLGRQQPHHD